MAGAAGCRAEGDDLRDGRRIEHEGVRRGIELQRRAEAAAVPRARYRQEQPDYGAGRGDCQHRSLHRLPYTKDS